MNWTIENGRMIARVIIAASVISIFWNMGQMI